MNVTISEENIKVVLDELFLNNSVIGDYENRQKEIVKRNVSLPILQGAYPLCSVIVHLVKLGFTSGHKLTGLVHNYFRDNKDLSSFDLDMPNWSTPYQIRNKEYDKLEFFFIEDNEDIIKNIKETYNKEIFELAQKRIDFIVNGTSKVVSKKKNK